MTQSFVETPEHVQSVPMHGTRATGLKIGSFRTARTIVIRAWGVDADSGCVAHRRKRKTPPRDDGASLPRRSATGAGGLEGPTVRP